MPIGEGRGGQIFRGAIVTSKCTQLIIAIMGDATIFRIGVQNNAATAASRIFLVCTSLIVTHSRGTLVANEVKKLSNKFVWGKKAVLEGQLPCAPPSYVPGSL